MNDADDAIPVDAGEFAEWLHGFRAVLSGGASSDVPCGTCTACCASSNFVTVRADEHSTRRHIPPRYLVDAPGRDSGDQLLGYDARGRCPMLSQAGCSIYAHRPRSCRSYDCRVYAAAEVEPAASELAIAERVRRWRFRYASRGAREAHAAVRRAAAFLRHGAPYFPGGQVPRHPVDVAVAAAKMYPAFLDEVPDDLELKRALALRAIDLHRAFDGMDEEK